MKDKDYKTEYEKLKGLVKNLYPHMSDYCKEKVDGYFPDIKKSEDEKFLKYIIDCCKATIDSDDKGLELSMDTTKRLFAWLEKHGGQKPVEEVNGEDYGIDSLWHAIRILEKTLGEVEGYQSDDGILEHKAAITDVKKLYKQKPVEWSKEDAEMLNSAILFVEHSISASSAGKGKYNVISWLKSLKEKMQFQSKQELSEAVNDELIEGYEYDL